MTRYTDKPRPTVFLPIPAYDWKIEALFQDSVDRAANGCHAQLCRTFGMGDGVARTRNNLAYTFLKETKCEFLFFVDSDIIFDPVDIDRIVSHGLPVVGGLYPKKSASLGWVYSSLPGEEVNEKTGLLKVRETGTGFLCVRRDVFEAMIAKWPEIRYEHDPVPGAERWDFFPMHAQGGRYLSEDWFFCDRVRQLGLDVHVDVTVQVKHIGKIVYPLHKTLTDDEVKELVARKGWTLA